MKNATEKKINWKKIAAFGGMFVAGVVVGVVGGEKVLGELSKNPLVKVRLIVWENDKAKTVRIQLSDPETGRALSNLIPKASMRDWADTLTELSNDSKVW